MCYRSPHGLDGALDIGVGDVVVGDGTHGVVISNPVVYFLDTTSMILGGVILGWAYVYDLRLPLRGGKTEENVPGIPPPPA